MEKDAPATDDAPPRKRGSFGQWCVYGIFRLFESGLGLLPLRMVFRLGQALGMAAWVLAVKYRRLARRNLEIAFGAEKTARELDALCRAHFVRVGANLLCSLKIPTMPQAAVEAVVEIEGFEHVEAARAAGRGFIFAIAHMGNWELLSQLPGICAGSPQGTLFQPLGNPHLNAHVARLRGRFGFRLFDRHDGFLAPAAFLRENGGLGILVDQHAGDGGVWAPLFGRLASTTNVAELLARRTGSPIIPLGMATAGAGRWRITLLPPLDLQKKRVTPGMNAAMETLIRRSPADWFWVHNRWKTPRPNFLLAHYKRGVEYPSPMADPASQLQPFEMLLRAPNWLGDACMALPAVRALKRGRPDARVTILTPAKLAQFWESIPEVDAIITKDGEEKKDGILAVRRKIKASGRRYDVAILLIESPRSALEVAGCGIPRLVGYRGRWRRRLLSQIVPPLPPGPISHHTLYFKRIAEHCGADDGAGELDISPRVGRARPPGQALRLGLCAGAEYGPAKRWPMEHFAQAARDVSRASGAEWTLLGAPSDTALGEALSALLEDTPHHNLVGKTSLRDLMEELQELDLLLTNDTGTMHLAASLGVPVVAIFGSTEPRWTGPLGEGHVVLRHHVPCSPCFHRECPLKTERYRCFEGITPARVAAAVLDRLSARPPTRLSA